MKSVNSALNDLQAHLFVSTVPLKRGPVTVHSDTEEEKGTLNGTDLKDKQQKFRPVGETDTVNKRTAVAPAGEINCVLGL